MLQTPRPPVAARLVVNFWKNEMKKTLFIIAAIILVSGCAVRQQDLDAWEGVPVEALDTHSLFLTLPVNRTITDSGIEIRNYMNRRNVGHCSGTGSGGGTGQFNGNQYMTSSNFNSFQNCVSQTIGCDNIFYIKDNRVIEYKPVGKRCFTDERVQPETRYMKLIKGASNE